MNITATLIIQVLAFITFIVLINRFLWTPLSGLMAARQKRIEEGLAAADRGQIEQEEAQEKIKQLLQQSKVQANDIIANAQTQANTIVQDAKDDAKLEAQKIKDNADADIVREISKAKGDLQAKVSGLVIKGVQVILNREINEDNHKRTLAALKI